MSTTRHPSDGDSRPCPQCHDTMVFSSRYPVLSVGMMLERTGSEPADRIRYERAWVCRNGGCDYRELAGDSALKGNDRWGPRAAAGEIETC